MTVALLLKATLLAFILNIVAVTVELDAKATANCLTFVAVAVTEAALDKLALALCGPLIDAVTVTAAVKAATACSTSLMSSRKSTS